MLPLYTATERWRGRGSEVESFGRWPRSCRKIRASVPKTPRDSTAMGTKWWLFLNVYAVYFILYTLPFFLLLGFICHHMHFPCDQAVYEGASVSGHPTPALSTSPRNNGGSIRSLAIRSIEACGFQMAGMFAASRALLTMSLMMCAYVHPSPNIYIIYILHRLRVNKVLNQDIH